MARGSKLKVAALNLPIDFVGPMEDHDRSDNIGEEILGKAARRHFQRCRGIQLQ